VRPLGRHVFLTLGQIDRIVSELPPFDTMGWSAEGQAALWVPVARVSAGGGNGRAVADELLMFTPFMWVDNPISLPSGREMYGFEKSWAWMDVPAAGGDESSFGLDVLGMDYDQNETPARRPLIRIERREKVHELAHTVWSGIVELGRHFKEVIEGRPGEAVRPGIELAHTLAADLRGGGLRQVFLQQLRSIEDGNRAAFQRVTAARYELLGFHGAPLEHEFEVTFSVIDTHPLYDQLGLTSQSTALGFRTESEFRLLPGEVLWDGAARPAAARTSLDRAVS
jgi:hypothetical protein